MLGWGAVGWGGVGVVQEPKNYATPQMPLCPSLSKGSKDPAQAFRPQAQAAAKQPSVTSASGNLGTTLLNLDVMLCRSLLTAGHCPKQVAAHMSSHVVRQVRFVARQLTVSGPHVRLAA